MMKELFRALVLLGAAIVVAAPAAAAPVAAPDRPAVSNIVPVQGWRERCHWLRERIRELEERIAYAPPWEQERLRHRLWERRHEYRESCRW